MTVTGAFLYSLESELGESYTIVEQAILVGGLFCRQVCLTEFQILDNKNALRFFKKHRAKLQKMVLELEADEVPLLGTCARKGADCWGALDLRLEPKLETRYPTYQSMLSPQQNAALREEYGQLKTAEDRRKRFLEVAGQGIRQGIQRAEEYFKLDPETTVVKSPGRPQEKLYDAVRGEVEALLASNEAPLNDSDKRICQALLEAIDRWEPGTPQTRERLHWAVYGEQSPPVFRGTVQWKESRLTPSPICDEWRFIINSVYNQNLAVNLGLRPVLNTSWWRVGHRFIPEGKVRKDLALEKAGDLPLSAPLYDQFLDLEFVCEVRKLQQFRQGIADLERARVAGEPDALAKAYGTHLGLVSERFAKHLTDQGRGDLAVKTVKDVAISASEKAILPAGAFITALALYFDEPPASAMEYGLRGVEQASTAALAVNKLFEYPPIKGVGQWRHESKQFKNFIMEIGRLGGATEEEKKRKGAKEGETPHE